MIMVGSQKYNLRCVHSTPSKFSRYLSNLVWLWHVICIRNEFCVSVRLQSTVARSRISWSNSQTFIGYYYCLNSDSDCSISYYTVNSLHPKRLLLLVFNHLMKPRNPVSERKSIAVYFYEGITYIHQTESHDEPMSGTYNRN